MFAVILTAQAQSFLTNGLVCYLPFSGNANDASGNGNNGNVINATLTSDRFGISASAYKFNGVQSASGSQVVVANQLLNLGQSAYTIQFWFSPDNNSQASCMLATYNSNTGLGVDYTPSTAPSKPVQFLAGNGVGTWNISGLGLSSAYQIGSWHLFTVTKTNTLYTVYMDGKFAAAATNSAALTYNWSDGLRLGAYLSNGSQDFAGNLDELRVYSRALTSGEVAAIYAYESAPIILLNKFVNVSSTNLHSGTNYIVQASTDLINWTNQGSVFTATNSTWASTNYWPVASWNQLYFRLQQQ
jgi:hypothetical protein